MQGRRARPVASVCEQARHAQLPLVDVREGLPGVRCSVDTEQVTFERPTEFARALK